MKHLLILFLVSGQAALAQSSPRFAIIRSVISGGGVALSTSGRFSLSGTTGQPVASTPGSSRFSIQGGYWIWSAPIVFAPAKVGDNFVLSFQTEPGKTYEPQYTDSLSNPAWQRLPGILGDGSIKTVTNSAPGVLQRCFRLKEQ